MFKPTYLYVKIHNETGLKYFGKTIKNDPYKYKGSGKYWKNHIEKHGNNVTTKILGLFIDEEDCKKVAIWFSIKNNIIESNSWANLKLEFGNDGGSFIMTEETKLKISKSSKGKPHSKKHTEKVSIALKGKKQKEKTQEEKDLISNKLSLALKGKKKPEGFAEKISILKRGSKLSENARQNMKNAWNEEKRKNQSERRKLLNSIEKQCPHCNKIGRGPNMTRYHFDNCKALMCLHVE